MPKLPEETIFLKQNGKYVPIGKIYDRDHVGYGNYFVYNSKYSRGIRWISASPNPDFLSLETAIEESRENLERGVREIISKFIENEKKNYYGYYLVDEIIQAVRKTFTEKKKAMLEKIK